MFHCCSQRWFHVTPRDPLPVTGGPVSFQLFHCRFPVCPSVWATLPHGPCPSSQRGCWLLPLSAAVPLLLQPPPSGCILKGLSLMLLPSGSLS